jgi:alcohol dehydrogenase (cytochrome c)
VKRLLQFVVFAGVVSLVLLTAVGASGSGSKSTAAIPAFSASDLSAASSSNWINEDGNIQSWRYSTLNQINSSNGGSLKLAWETHLASPATPEKLASGNANPIVYNGIMYVQDAYTRITAIDAASGKTLWQFDPQVGLNVPGNGTDMRSLGMGGGMIFTAAYGTIYGLNAQTGAQVWATQVLNPVGGGGIDTSPIYYKGLVLVGSTGGDWGGSCAEFALDAKTGKVTWHYSNIPSNAKAYGWNTWPSQRYYYGGGAVWDMLSIDPKLDLVYAGVGNPLPFNGLINAAGAEYGTEGVYALHAMTGKFAWFFQEVHHDIWDYDGMQTPLVETITKGGKSIDVIDHINKDAYNYVLDAATGKPVDGVVETPVPQDPRDHTFPTQPIPTGDELVPHVVADPQDYQGVLAPDGKPFIVATSPFTPYDEHQYTTMAPTFSGGVEWPNPAWDPKNGVEIVCANVTSFGVEAPPIPDQHPVVTNVGNVIALKTASVATALSISRLVAFDPSTNKIVWKHDDTSTGGLAAGNSAPCSSPVTISAGGVAIIGRIVASSSYPTGVSMIQGYDVKTGALDWQFPVLFNGTPAPAVPRIALYSVGGKEYLVSFMHSAVLGADISAYTLP